MNLERKTDHECTIETQERGGGEIGSRGDIFTDKMSLLARIALGFMMFFPVKREFHRVRFQETASGAAAMGATTSEASATRVK